MAARPVEWVLVIYYGPSAHRATYGRLSGQDTKYTKDYIQLSRKPDFANALNRLFPTPAGGVGAVPLEYRWPTGIAPGELVFHSADRPHLKWGTSLGAPKAWKMSLTPSDGGAETIPGDPSHLDFASAENELELVASRGAGQPYLMAIKLRDEPRTLHLRAYLENPSRDYAWADFTHLPTEICELARKTSRSSALASTFLVSGGVAPGAAVISALTRISENADPEAVIGTLDANVGPAISGYLRSPGYGLFFDPTINHDAWSHPSAPLALSHVGIERILRALDARFPVLLEGDAAAENLETDPDEVDAFRKQIDENSYGVADASATVKTRGSAQRAFAGVVKANYNFTCAITGIVTKEFLVAAHIVPWSKDPSIRLDPSNGICLSLFVDRAYENGYLKIEDDFTVQINWTKVGDDQALRNHLEPFHGKMLKLPTKDAPQAKYLQRRRVLVSPSD